MKIILASQSPRRKQLLSLIGVDFEIIPATGEEIVKNNLSFGEIVTEIAKEKAKEVFQKTSGDRVIIASDTVVVYNNEIMGKPKDEQDARRMLRSLRGSKHFAYTGLSVFVEKNGVLTQHNNFDEIEVFFKDYSDEIIEKYIASGEPMDKAGAYTIQGIGAILLKKINGNPAAITGMSIEKIADIFTKENIPFLEFETPFNIYK